MTDEDRHQPLPHPRRAHRPRGQRQDPQGRPGRRAARSRSSSACSPARRPRCAPTRACATSCAAACSPARPASGSGSRSPSAAATPTRSPSTRGRRAPPGSGSTRSRARAASARPTRRRRRCSPSSRRSLATDGRPAQHLVEEAREHGWTDEQMLEAVAQRGDERVPEPDRERGRAAAGPGGLGGSARRRLAARRRRPPGSARRISLATRMSPVDSKRERLGGRLGEVPLGAVRERAAVDHRRADEAALVAEHDLRAAGQRPVGDAHGVPGERLAAGGLVAEEAGAVPGRALAAASTGSSVEEVASSTTPVAPRSASRWKSRTAVLGRALELVDEGRVAEVLGPQDPVQRLHVAAAIAELERAPAELGDRSSRARRVSPTRTAVARAGRPPPPTGSDGHAVPAACAVATPPSEREHDGPERPPCGALAGRGAERAWERFEIVCGRRPAPVEVCAISLSIAYGVS